MRISPKKNQSNEQEYAGDTQPLPRAVKTLSHWTSNNSNQKWKTGTSALAGRTYIFHLQNATFNAKTQASGHGSELDTLRGLNDARRQSIVHVLQRLGLRLGELNYYSIGSIMANWPQLASKRTCKLWCADKHLMSRHCVDIRAWVLWRVGGFLIQATTRITIRIRVYHISSCGMCSD